MNVAYFLKPKSEIAYMYDDFSIRQSLEKFRMCGYVAVPVITRDGRYVGTIASADLLNKFTSILSGISINAEMLEVFLKSPMKQLINKKK